MFCKNLLNLLHFEYVLGSPRLCTDPGPPLLRASGEAFPGQNHGGYSILLQQLEIENALSYK